MTVSADNRSGSELRLPGIAVIMPANQKPRQDADENEQTETLVAMPCSCIATPRPNV
jgi:hypothetical protein